MSETGPPLPDLEEVLVRYAFAIDTKNWDLFATCFAPDLRADYDDRTFTSAADITSYMERVHRYLDASQHRITNVVRLRGDDSEVSTRTYVDAVLVRRDHPEGPAYRVAGYYDDRFAELDGRWVIATRIFRTVWSQGSRAIGR